MQGRLASVFVKKPADDIVRPVEVSAGIETVVILDDER
ncbi:hypothetical protein [Micromonospora tarensis]